MDRWEKGLNILLWVLVAATAVCALGFILECNGVINSHEWFG